VVISLMRPLLDYRSAVWDPYLHKDILNIEMVQRCAGHWVKSDYGYNSSVLSLCYLVFNGLLLGYNIRR